MSILHIPAAASELPLTTCSAGLSVVTCSNQLCVFSGCQEVTKWLQDGGMECGGVGRCCQENESSRGITCAGSLGACQLGRVYQRVCVCVCVVTVCCANVWVTERRRELKRLCLFCTKRPVVAPVVVLSLTDVLLKAHYWLQAAQWLWKSYQRETLTKVTHWIHYSCFSFLLYTRKQCNRIEWPLVSHSYYQKKICGR